MNYSPHGGQESKMKFKCENSKQVAREQYYQASRTYTVDVPDEMIPHHIRVWLIDEYSLPAFVLDDATPDMVIDALQNLIDQRKRNADLVIKKVLETPSDKLIKSNFFYRDSRCGQSIYYIVERIPLPDEVVGYWDNFIRWDDERLAEKKAEVSAICKALNAAEDEMVKATISSIEQSQEEEKRKNEEDIAERKSAIKTIIPDEDMDRYMEDLMPEPEQRNYLRDAMIPTLEGAVAFKKIRPSDICDCGSDGSYEYCDDEIDDMTREEYREFSRIRRAYPDAEVRAEMRIGHCSNCDNGVIRKVAVVERKVGDWTLNRRYCLS